MIRNLFALLLAGICLPACAQESTSLEGLWKAHKRFDTYMEGPLVLDFETGTAEMGGHRAEMEREGERFSVTFPDAIGSFHGRWVDDEIRTHWRQPAPKQLGMPMANPVKFSRLGDHHWMGVVVPMPSQFTFFLPIEPGDDGIMRTFLRNPERNLGVFAQVTHVEKEGERLSLVGNWRGSDNQEVLFEGVYDEEFDRFTVELPPWRGGIYEFNREEPEAESQFFARAASQGAWQYRAPPELHDGWPVGSLESAGISEEPIRRMIVEEIGAPARDVHAHYVHGVLIARGGKLVLEEYFHGFHRDMPHDTRSAGKSLASVLAGAVIHQGADLALDTPVYESLGENLDGLDERKRAMTLEHLLTMSSGFYCDDNDSEAPGNEDTMQSPGGPAGLVPIYA